MRAMPKCILTAARWGARGIPGSFSKPLLSGHRERSRAKNPLIYGNIECLAWNATREVFGGRKHDGTNIVFVFVKFQMFSRDPKAGIQTEAKR